MYIEFLGIPRERAGLSELEIDAGTLGEALEHLGSRLPRLRDLMSDSGLHASIVANLNGDRFISDLATPLAATDHVLILSADAGG